MIWTNISAWSATPCNHSVSLVPASTYWCRWMTFENSELDLRQDNIWRQRSFEKNRKKATKKPDCISISTNNFYTKQRQLYTKLCKIGYQNTKRRIHRWVNILLIVVAPRMILNSGCLSQSRETHDHRSCVHTNFWSIMFCSLQAPDRRPTS